MGAFVLSLPKTNKKPKNKQTHTHSGKLKINFLCPSYLLHVVMAITVMITYMCVCIYMYVYIHTHISKYVTYISSINVHNNLMSITIIHILQMGKWKSRKVMSLTHSHTSGKW